MRASGCLLPEGETEDRGRCPHSPRDTAAPSTGLLLWLVAGLTGVRSLAHRPAAQQGLPSPQAWLPPSRPQVKRTNLKKPNSERTGHGLRVRFNPLALLLDASLEGEFDLVQRVIYEVRGLRA